MPRDYKHATRRRRRKRTIPPWIWALVGLLIGLFVAFLVYLKTRAPQAPVIDVPEHLELPAEGAEPVMPEPPPPPPPAKPRFDFYDLLPEMEVVVPEEELEDAPVDDGVRQVEQPGVYLLQAGSFRRAAQAEQLRARLALLGLETDVQRVEVKNRETWHRVRVGPYRDLEDLNRARSQLKAAGVDAILIRIKE